MALPTQPERTTYDFWRDVRIKLLDKQIAEPDAAIQRYIDFVTEKSIPWDLVFHEGADEVALSIVEAERLK